MTDEEIYAIGMDLELAGFNHSQIDVYFEHHGVKGQKWGTRRAKKQAARVQKRKDINYAMGVGLKQGKSLAEAKVIADNILKKKGYIVLNDTPKPSKATKAIINGIVQNGQLHVKIAQIIAG